MKGEVTIQSAIDELQRCFKSLNEIYFLNELERPVISLHTDSSSSKYGWITENKVWSSKDKLWFREINICAEFLNRDTVLVITTLLHEMSHLYNIQNDIQDCSRGGMYHNVKFKEAAEKCGLIVEKDEKYGYSITNPSDEIKNFVKKKVRSGCFKLERMRTYKNGTERTITIGKDGKEKTTSRTKQSTKKYKCPGCGLIIRATKDITGKVACLPCGQIIVADGADERAEAGS